MPDDLQRDLSQKSRLQTLSILVFIVAIVTIAAMTYVQTVLVPGFVEIAVPNRCATIPYPRVWRLAYNVEGEIASLAEWISVEFDGFVFIGLAQPYFDVRSICGPAAY
jgi:hypothetical protein